MAAIMSDFTTTKPIIRGNLPDSRKRALCGHVATARSPKSFAECGVARLDGIIIDFAIVVPSIVCYNITVVDPTEYRYFCDRFPGVFLWMGIMTGRWAEKGSAPGPAAACYHV